MTTTLADENIEHADLSLSQWLDRLETAHPKKIDLGLDRVRLVAERLDLLKPRVKVITVAGTNGKGSYVAALEALLLNTGKHVGAYTSPHMMRYNERIKINGTEVSDASVCGAFKKIEVARQQISLTYFEYGTLAALLLFKDVPLDYIILEVGLGGRLDAVNIIDPDLAVITSIDLDHEEWLGNTREKISEEKLGILRRGIPCVCAERNLTETMRAMFRAMNSEVYLMGRDFDVEIKGRPSIAEYKAQVQCEYRSPESDSAITFIDKGLSPYSVGAAIQTLTVLGEVVFKEEEASKIENSINRVLLPGRNEQVKVGGQHYVMDVAHNSAATTVLANRLVQEAFKADIAIVGMMSDKNITEAMLPLLPCVSKWAVCDIPENSRAETKEKLKQILVEAGVYDKDVELFENVEMAMNDLNECANRVLVMGSFLTVSAARRCLELQ
ncbi:MAG: bifunctional folylpolyglutamate synthase/dihydrofolate synthase [Agarilytica sp.]